MTEIKNNAFYYEICLLRILAEMGYLDNKAVDGIAKIAEEDYKATIIVDKSFLCPK